MSIFRTVAECSSFAKAAELLDLPRPTVTNAVQRVEQQLGVRLLQRTTRKVSLTLEGSIYLERCSRLLGELEDMNAQFRGPGHVPGGVVRVELPERMAHANLLPKLPAFFAAYPDISVKVGANDRFADLVGEGIDCAVRVGRLRDSSLVARPIGQMEQVNLASPDYLAHYGVPHAPADLGEHVAVNFFSSQSGRDLEWEYEEGGRTHTVAMRSRVSVGSTEAYLAGCRSGLGLIQAPRMGLEAELASGLLVEVMPSFRPAPLPVSIVYSHSRQLSPRVRVFIDWLARELAIR